MVPIVPIVLLVLIAEHVLVVIPGAAGVDALDGVGDHAVDCGTVVNPDTVQAQVESAIMFGITAALYGGITVKNGRVEQTNFDTYPILRMSEAPAVEVYIVQNSEPPGGLGEAGTSAIVPAVTNAIFAATGKRLRKLPIDPAVLRSG